MISELLAVDPVSGALLTRVPASGKPLALPCHAPVAAFAAPSADGSWPCAGYRMTGLSNVEEKFNGFGRKARWLPTVAPLATASSMCAVTVVGWDAVVRLPTAMP